jgi:hypothetical protein
LWFGSFVNHFDVVVEEESGHDELEFVSDKEASRTR